MNEPPDTAARPTAPRSAMLTVFLVVFIDLLGFGIVLPLLPRVADDYLAGYTPLQRGGILGALYSSFSVMQFVFSPVWGRLSDRVGRRPVLLISLTGSVVFYGLFAVAATVPATQGTLALLLLLVSRIGAGIAGASVSTAAAVIADCTTKENRAKGMALIGVAFGFGFTLGPLIAYAGLELFNGQRWGVGAVASALSLVALVVAFLKFKETKTVAGGETTARELFSVKKSVDVVRDPAVGPAVLTLFLTIFAFAIFEGTLSLFTKAVFGMEERANFLVFAYIGFVLMVAQGGVYRRLAGKVSEVKLIAAGAVMMIVGLAGVGGIAVAATFLSEGTGPGGLKTVFYLATATAVFGFAFVNPSLSALISKRADPARQGEVQGVGQSFSSLGRILGPAIGLFAFEQDTTRHLAPYALAVVTLLIVIVLLPQLSQKSDGTRTNAEADADPRGSGS